MCQPALGTVATRQSVTWYAVDLGALDWNWPTGWYSEAHRTWCWHPERASVLDISSRESRNYWKVTIGQLDDLATVSAYGKATGAMWQYPRKTSRPLQDVRLCWKRPIPWRLLERFSTWRSCCWTPHFPIRLSKVLRYHLGRKRMPQGFWMRPPGDCVQNWGGWFIRIPNGHI